MRYEELTINFDEQSKQGKNLETFANVVANCSSSLPIIGDAPFSISDEESMKSCRNSRKKALEYRIKHGSETFERLFGCPFAPEEPARRPKFIRDITSPAPENAKTAAGKFLLPAFATYANSVRAVYNDYSYKELRLNSFVATESGGGKGIVKPLLDAVLFLIALNDENGWQTDKNYKRLKDAAGDTKTELKPQVHIQILLPNITMPELNSLGEAAGDKPFFMHIQEPDELDILSGGKYGRQHFELLKKSDDENNTSGQMRVGAKSVSAKYNLRMNFVLEIRPSQLLDFFSGEIINGARDRADICEIKSLPNVHLWPKRGRIDDSYKDKISPYIENLRAAKGEYKIKRANDLVDSIRDEFLAFIDETQDMILERISHRALCRAFRRAVLCYLANAQKWDSALDEWIRWSFMYDIWMQHHYFYDAIKSENGKLTVTKQGPTALRNSLPQEFSFEQLKELYISRDMYTDDTKIHGALRVWINRGHIERTSTGYRQIKK